MAVPLAEPGQRLLARVVDTLVVGVPVILVVRAFVSGPAVDVVAPPVLAGCMLVYEAVQLALWGRTLGKRVAGIEVVAATRQEADQPSPGGAGDAEPGPVPLIPASVPGFVPTAASSGGEGPAGERGASGKRAPAGARLDVLHAVARAAVYSLPIALRPIPVLGLLASIFWVGNAGMLFEGTRRQAVHDRLAGTVVVKRPDSDSPAF
ncbi:RDD family protein [Actinomadura sp. B10D3]|uniref:RDD family protein n=1 Tax=Actinomadura sp. B10D3 TaxID=3153557 RepID=UPI00325C5E4C